MYRLLQFFCLMSIFCCSSLSQIFAQTPTVTNGVPSEGFIGEQVCFPVTLENIGAPGYGPYIRLVLPPELSFNSATFSSGAQIIQNLGIIVAPAPNNFIIDPIAQSNTGSTTSDTIFAPVGSSVILLQYPVGSIVQNGITLISEVCVTVDALATLDVPVDFCVQGIYEFGDTPTGSNGPIAGLNLCQQITPILYRFDKQVNGSDGIYEEVPGGGGVNCHVHPYQLNVDIAAAGILNAPVTFTDVLPGEITYLGNISLPPGCTAVEPTIGSNGGTLTVTCTGTYNGSIAAIDMQVAFDAAVRDTLDETICDDIDFINVASVTAAGQTKEDSVESHIEHVNLVHSNNATGAVVIGQTVGYTINFDITEYTAGLNAASITFEVPDGMIYDPASLTWAGIPVAPANVTIAPGIGTGSIVTVDVFAANGGNILPCASSDLQYNAEVAQQYTGGATPVPVLSRDPLEHTSTITYNLVEGANGCTDDSGTTIRVIDISFNKVILNSPPNPNGQWHPGDIVVYQLTLQIPSLDLDDVVITDFFPLPIHNVSDLAATFGTDVVFDPSSCWTTPPISYTRNVATNSLALDFGDLSNSVTGGCVDVVVNVSIPITTIPYADGLFHSNFIQVNSDNSTQDNITTSNLTLFQVAAPNLEITKGITSSNNTTITISPIVTPPDGDAVNVDGSDSLFFQITVANTGGAPAYDVQIRDVLPPALTNCALVGPDPVVDAGNNPLAFTGGFSGNILTIDLAAPNDSLIYASAPTQNHTVSVSYVCVVDPGVANGINFDNTAAVDWSSSRGDTKFPPIEDMASVETLRPRVDKTIDYIFPDYNGSRTRASIGEVVAYAVDLYIPEGTLTNAMLVDQLDEGLAFVGVDSIVICNSSGANNITTSIGGSFGGVQAGAMITALGANPQQQDRVLTLDFGTLINADTDNLEDTIKVYYRTIVINHPTNTDGEQVRNRAQLSWQNPNNPANDITVTDRAPFVTIVEPQLIVTKSFVPNEVLPGNNSFVTITVQNPGTSTAPAFDVSLMDIMPVEMTFVSGFAHGGTANITTNPANAGSTITAHWDTINIGETYSITFEVQASSSVIPCTTLVNCANIVWESIAEADEASMPLAFSSPLGIKRTGNTGGVGGTANTYSQDSCSNLDVIIDNTFDPFITANTPVCEGERVVLAVQQYNGNIVRYNWTGPGVPPGYNNYELILDPVTVADVGTYFVYVELDGCVTDTSNFFDVTLRPKPSTPNITPDTTVCEGGSIQFSTDTIATTYTWTGPNGFSANAATTPLISPVTLADAGIYTLVTTNTQGCSSDPVNVTLSVTPRPAQPSLANNTPICSGENIVLSSSSAATSYQWIAPNGQDTITTTSTLTISSASNLYLAGNWTLVIFNADGCPSLASPVANVIINTTPLNPVTSNTGPICEGQAVTLNVNSVMNGTYAWYSDAALTNLVASTQNPTISGLLAANSPDTFYVQVTANGCISDTGFTVVTVNANPAAITPNYTPLCAGDTIFLMANTTANNYSWTGPNGFVSNLQNPAISNSSSINAGSYTLSITDANGCSTSGIVQVAVEDRPATPNITSNGPLCVGDGLMLTVGTYTGTNVTYTWSTPTGVITTGVPSLTINPTTAVDNGIYSVVVNVDGCTSLADSINVTINSLPAVPVVASNSAVCEGDTLVLTTTSNANMYNWTGPNGFTSNVPNPSVITPVTAANAGTYNLVITDANGCTATASTAVIVNNAPAQPSMTNNGALCAGEAIVLSTNATAMSYIWTAPNGADTTTTTSAVTISSTSSLYQSGGWTLAVVDANSCTSASSVTSNVVINTVPTTAIAGNNGPVCVGSSAQLSAGNVNGGTYTWYTDAGATNAFSTIQNPVVSNIIANTTFYLVVTVNDCDAPLDSTTVHVHAVPTAPVVPANFAVCEGDVITLTTTTVAMAYSWTGPNGFSSTAQNPSTITNATSANAGVYNLVITDANGCTSAVSSTTVTVNSAPTQPSMTNNGALCAGEAIVLSTNATATSYIWTAPNGADTTTTTSAVIIPSTSSLYQSGGWTLAVVDANGCTSSTSVPSIVEINSVVSPAAFNNGPVCIGNNVTLNTAMVSGASYAWYSDAGLTNLVATIATTTINNITTDSTFYLVVTVNGCPSVAVSTTVTTHSTPATPTVPANFAICAGEAIVLTTPTVATAYSWTGPNGFSSTAQNPAAINPATSLDGGTYTLNVVDANGCQSANASVVVTVNTAPTAPVLTNNSAICDGDTLVLSTTASADTFIWTAPNGLDTITTTNNLVILPTNTTYYQSGDWTLVTQVGNNCPSMPSVASTVVINSSTVAPAAFNDGPVCIGGIVTLSTPSVPNAFYQWYTDAGLTNLIATTATTTVNNITTDSTFYLVVTVSGCTSPASSTTITVINQPAAPSVPADFAVCEGEDITLTTSTIAAAYNWTGPNGFVSNLQSPPVITNATIINQGVYNLIVTFANGCVSADTNVTVTVNANPAAPVITANSPLCFGDTLTLTSSANCGQSQWIGPNGNSSGTLGTPGGNNVLWTIGTTTNIPPTDPNYLGGTWSMVCIDTLTGCSIESASITVDINAIPATPVVSNNGPVCVGSTAELTTSNIVGATYTWYSDAGLTTVVSTLQNPTIANITTDTTWYLVVTVNGCSSMAGSTTVNVHPVPARPNVPADFAVCEGDNIVLTTSTVAAGYNWTGPNGFQSNLQQPTVVTSASSVDAGVYTLSIIDANGCPSGDTSVTVTVNANPAAPIITANSPLCFGDTLTLTSSANCGQSQWIGPNGNSSGTLGTPGGNNVLWTLGTTTNIPPTDPNYLGGTWTMICIDTITGCRAESAPINVAINPIPTVHAFNNGSICSGDNGILTANAITGATYAWYTDAALTSLVSTSRITTISNMTMSTTYYVVATVNGCSSLADSTIITVNPRPTTSASYTPLCQLDTLFLQSNATGAIATYAWTGPNGFTSNAANPVLPNMYPSNAGSYVVVVTDSTGCQAISTVEVTVYPKPQTPVIAHNAPFCENTGDLMLTTQAYFGTDVHYIWILPNGQLDTTLVPSFTVNNATQSDTGVYGLIVLVDGCVSLPASAVITIYPTPAIPSVPADFALCEGEAIVLSTTTIAAGYNWTGPNGFQSNLPSPTVVRATAVDAGVYTLSVTNIWGCQSADTSVTVTVNANPAAPVITANSPLCFGDTLTLTSSADCGQSQWIGPNGNSSGTLGTPGGNNVLWTLGTTTNIPSTDPNYLSGNWTMICIDTLTGCRTESAPITVDITPIPATPAVFNNSPICVGSTVQLNTAAVNGASYAWYSDAALTNLVSTSQNPMIANITTDTTFYLTITVNGCTSLAGSTQVTVYPVPATPSVPANFAVCEGDVIALSTTTVAAGYNWTGPNGFVSNLQNPSVVQATAADAGVYTLSMIDVNGCPSADTSVTVTVNLNPTQPVLSSNSAICDGDNLVLSTTATAATYQWIAPNGADTITTTNNVTINNTSNFYQAGTWTLIIANVNGCSSIPSNLHNVIIYTIPATQIVFNNGPVCAGESVNLFTSQIAGATYTWYSDAALTNIVATSQNPTINNITTDSTFYLAITVNGCTSPAGATTVQVHPTPATPAIPADFTVCEGDAIVLNTTTIAATYLWTGPNGFQSNLQQPTVISSASLIDSGTYYLSIIDQNGCVSDDTTVQVTVNPIPNIPTIIANNSPICAGDSVILTASIGIVGTTYEWFNSANVSVGTGITLVIPNVTTADADAYTVVATLNGCSSIPSKTVVVQVNEVPNITAYAGLDVNLCNTFVTHLEATIPVGATGLWTTNSTATIANPSIYNTAVYNLPAGSSTFYWTLSNGACNDFSMDSVVVDVTPASNDIANAGIDQSLCGQSTATLNATVPTVGGGEWTQSPAQAGQGVSITNPADPNSTVTGLQQGNVYAFTWTLSNGNCTDYSSDAVLINIDVAPPDNAYAGADILVCNQNTINLDAFVSQYGTGQWTALSGGNIVDPTMANSIVTNLPQDTSLYIWTLSNGTCLNYSTDTVMVVSSITTDVADAGLNQVICSVNSVTLAAVAPSAGTGEWSQTASQAAQGVVIVNPSDPNSQVVGLAPGNTYAFTWTLSNGTCQDYSSAIVTVAVNATPPDNAFAGNDINICGTTTVTNLTASIPIQATGLWTTTSTATISNPTLPNSTVSGLSMGTNIFVWTLSSGSCLDYDNDTLVITVTMPSSDTADAGLDSAYCAQSTITLDATAPSVGGGYWSQTPSQASLGAIINNPALANSTISGLTPGITYTFNWTLTNGGCVDYSTDQTLITVDVLPSNIAYAGEDTILCGGNSITLDGLAPSLGTGFWTTSDSATIVTPVDNNTLVVDIMQDTTTYYWTLSNGSCVDYSMDSVNIIISPVSTDLAFAGFDSTLCGVSSIALNASVPTTSTGLWTQTAGQSSQGVIITDPTNPNTTITGIQNGQSYSFTWTLSTVGCADFSSDDVVYTINALPTEVAYAGPDIVLCSGNATVLDASIPVFSAGIWSTNSSSIIINPTLPNSNVVNMPADTIEFYWSLSNGSCLDYSIDTVEVIVTPLVDTAYAGLDIGLCNVTTATLSALSPSTATGQWQQPLNQSSTGVTITDPMNPNSIVTGLQIDSTYSFTWSLTTGPCADYDQDQVNITVSSLPTDAAYAGQDVIICGNDQTTLTATAPSQGNGIWTTTSPATIVTPPSTTTEILNLGIGGNVFIWTLSNGACIDYSADTVLITTDDAPIANADSFVLIYNSNINTIDVLPNDSLNSNWEISVVEGLNSGSLTNIGNGQFDIVLQDILTDQSFIYQLCNPNCPEIYCDTALVILDVQGGTDCVFPNTMTPNNDGANDNFVVPCLDGLTGTKLQIFNRWGDLMYENDNYENNWDGTHNGEPVPDATYFYIMELADGQKFQGFVEVRR